MTPREFADAGIHRQVLSRLVADGRIERVAQSLYRLASPTTENHGHAVAAAAVPQGVI